ncbi:MAG: hypothetical protein AAF384_17005 [Pseudomonadota bacterium]
MARDLSCCYHETMRSALFILAVFTVHGVSAVEPMCAENIGPKKAVEGYVKAMAEHRFEEAYEHLTPNMTSGMEVGKWAASQRLVFEAGEVTIFGIDIREPRGHEDDPDCGNIAVVPNILKSRDKFNNQGITEFEVYRVKRSEDGLGRWYVDEQTTFYEEEEINAWFPGEQIPEFDLSY